MKVEGLVKLASAILENQTLLKNLLEIQIEEIMVNNLWFYN